MKKAGFRKWIIGVMAAALVFGSISGLGTAQAAAKVKLNKTKLSLVKGKSATLKLKNNKKKVTWKTSNKKVATVSSKGLVRAKKKGNATITAKIKVKGKVKKYHCKVTVSEKKTTTANMAKLPTPDKVKLGMSEAQVKKLLGTPKRIDTSPVGFKMWVYINKSSSQYMLVNVKNSKVVGVSAMASGISYGNELKAGAAASTLEKDSDWREVSWYRATDSSGSNLGAAAYTKSLSNANIIAFTDVHASKQGVYFVQVFSDEYSVDDMTKPDKNYKYSAAVINAIEQEVFEMMGVYRVIHGLPAFTRLSGLDKVAGSVSDEMAESQTTTAVIRNSKDILMDMIKQGCDPLSYAEDTAYGSMDAAGFFHYMVEYKEMQGHLLAKSGSKAKYAVAGVGCASVPASSQNNVYLTVEYCSDDYDD